MDPIEARKWIDKLSLELLTRRGDIADFNEYYRGDQALKFASPEWRKHHKDRYAGFSDNWCGVVANAPNERLRVLDIRVGDKTLEKQFAKDWLRNDMDAQSSAGFLQSIIAKRSFVLVWRDEDGDPEYTWEHPSEAIVAYDPAHPRRRLAGMKLWRDDEWEHATLYTPDEIWKFSRKSTQIPPGLVLPTTVVGLGGEGWEPREVEGEDWPLSHDLGRVPLVEFPNRPMLGGEPMSDVAGTMAMQDAINLLWAYAFSAADYASMPARVIMGQAPPKLPILDENGQKIGEREIPPEDLRQGRLLWLTGQNTSIGQWDPAKLDAFTDVVEVAISHVAAQTRTPAHYLINTGSSTNAPAESFTAAETGLVKKVEETQLFLNAPVREVHYLSAMVRGDKAAAKLTDSAIVLWKDAENHSRAQLADALMKLRQIGFPFEWIAEKYGLDATEVARVVELQRAEGDAGMLATLTDALRVGQKPAPDQEDPEDPADQPTPR